MLFRSVQYSEIQRDYPDQWRDFVHGRPEFFIAGGESFSEFVERVAKVLDDIRQKHSDGRILIVSHWGCISVIIPYLLELKGDAMWKFAVRPGGVSRIEILDGFSRLTKLNL